MRVGPHFLPSSRSLLAGLMLSLMAGTLAVVPAVPAVAEPSDWAVSLEIENATFEAGEDFTLTAEVQAPDGFSEGYSVLIEEVGADPDENEIEHCYIEDALTTCSATHSFKTGEPRSYVANVYPESWDDGVEAASNEVTATRAPWSISLAAERPVFESDENPGFVATTNQRLDTGGYGVIFYDGLTGAPWQCSSYDRPDPFTCTANYVYAGSQPRSFFAVVSLPDGSDVQAVSNRVSVMKEPWSLTMTKVYVPHPLGSYTDYVATPNQPLAWGYRIRYVDVATGASIWHCTSGTKCEFRDLIKGRVLTARIVDSAGNVVTIADGDPSDSGRLPMSPDQSLGGGNPSEVNSQCYCADPVNTATGEFFDNVTDLSIDGRYPLEWTRSYSSMREAKTSLGRGWTSILDAHISDQPVGTGGVVAVVQENGAVSRFMRKPNGTFLPLGANLTATLARDAVSQSWTLTRRDGTSLVFGAEGRLLRISDRNGESVILERTDPNYPARVTALSGSAGQIALSYNVAGLVSQATATGNRTFKYTYDTSDRLVTVTDPLNKIFEYGYDAQHRVVTMTAADLSVVSNEYDNEGRVTVQTDQLGGETSFEYGAESGEVTWTTVTNQSDRQVKYTYDNGWLVQKTMAPEGSTPRVWLYVNGNTGQPVRVIDPLGNQTVMTYNPTGDRTSVTSPSGAVTRFTYSNFGEAKTITDPKGTVTTNTYDLAGNLTSASTPLNETETATETFTYGDLEHPGDVTASTDPRGNTTTLQYDSAGRLTKTMRPSGATETRSYTIEGWAQSIVPPGGNVTGSIASNFTTTYTHDALGRVLTVRPPTGANGGAVTLTYDSAGRVATKKDALGRSETFAYDLAGRQSSKVDRRGKVTQYAYDPSGLLLSVEKATGAKTSYAYDAFGQLANATGPEGNVAGASQSDQVAATSTFGYDAAGRATSVSHVSPDDGSPIITSTSYDPDGRVTQVTKPLLAPFEYKYDLNSNVTEVVDPTTGKNTYTFDKANRPVSSTDVNGHTTTFGHDLSSHRTRETSPMGRTTTWTFNTDGQMASTTTPRGNAIGAIPSEHRTVYSYDPDGNIISIITPLNGETKYRYQPSGHVSQRIAPAPANASTFWYYNALGNLTSVVRANGVNVRENTTYDADDNVLTRTNALGHVTSYTYDDDGRVATVANGHGGIEKRLYTASGLLLSRETPKGVTSYAHDSLGRLTGIDYPDATTDVSHEYDALDRRVATYDAQGFTRYTYNPQSRLRTASTNSEAIFSWNYDAVGNITSAGTRLNGAANDRAYTYNADDLPTVMTVGAGTQTAQTMYSYDDNGMLSTQTLPNGTSKAHARDALGRTTSLVHNAATGVIASRTYAYDSHNNIRSAAVTRDGQKVTRQYKYDSGDRLTSECLGTTCSPTSPDATSYTYDLAGNQTSRTVNGIVTAYTYDSASKMLSSKVGNNPANTDYTYDDEGNLLTDGARTFTYNAARQVVSTRMEGTGNVAQFDYDADGNRIRRTTPSGTTWYDWDINRPTPMLMHESTGIKNTDYQYNPDGTPHSISKNESMRPVPWGTPITTWHFLTDELGSVSEVTDTTGQRAKSYEYTPYGEQRGPPAADTATAPTHQPFQFAGEYLDSSTGLYNLRARQYDPVTGRFTSTDPIGGAADTITGSSLYAYANSNPIRYTDPLGLAGVEDIAYEVGLGITSFGNAASFGLSGDIAELLSPGAYCIVETASNRYVAARYMGYVAGGVDAGVAMWTVAKAAPGAVAAARAAGQRWQTYRNAARARVETSATRFEAVPRDGGYVDFNAPITLPYSKSRPKFRKGIVEQVWERAKDGDGLVFDPNTGQLLTWDKTTSRAGQWDMGHIPDEKYSEKLKRLHSGELTKKQFRDWYNEPAHYLPEHPSANRSHAYE